MNKELYIRAEMEVIEFETEDVILASDPIESDPGQAGGDADGGRDLVGGVVEQGHGQGQAEGQGEQDVACNGEAQVVAVAGDAHHDEAGHGADEGADEDGKAGAGGDDSDEATVENHPIHCEHDEEGAGDKAEAQAVVHPFRDRLHVRVTRDRVVCHGCSFRCGIKQRAWEVYHRGNFPKLCIPVYVRGEHLSPNPHHVQDLSKYSHLFGIGGRHLGIKECGIDLLERTNACNSSKQRARSSWT